MLCIQQKYFGMNRRDDYLERRDDKSSKEECGCQLSVNELDKSVDSEKC